MKKIFQYPGSQSPPVQPVAEPWFKRNTYYLATSKNNSSVDKSGATYWTPEDKYLVVRNNVENVLKFNRDGSNYGTNVNIDTADFEDTESITYLGESHPSGKKFAIVNEGDTSPATVKIVLLNFALDDTAPSDVVGYSCPNINTVNGSYGAEGVAWDERRGVFYIATQACTTGDGGLWQVTIDWGTSAVTEKLLFRWFDTIVSQGHAAINDFISELYYNPENLGVSNFVVLLNVNPLASGATKILEVNLNGTVVATRALPSGQYEGLTFSNDAAKDMFIATEEAGTDIYVFKRNLNTWQQPISQPRSPGYEADRRAFFESYSPPFVPQGSAVSLDGVISASSTVSGNIALDLPLSGTVSAASTVSGNLALALPLAGTIAGASTVSGELGLALPLAGTIAASATVSGNLAVTLSLSGTVSAASTVSGNLAVALPISGTIAAASTVSGELALAIPLSGTISAASTVSGDLTVQGQVDLSGTISASSSVSGELAIALPLTGTVAAASTVAGNLALAIPLSGTVSATSTVSGDLTVQGQVELSGSITAASTVSGNLALALPLSGAVSASSTVSGELIIAGQVALSGSISAASTVSGNLGVAMALSGAVAAAASVSGNLARQVSLGGEVSAASSASGSIVLTVGLYAVVSAQGVVAGAIGVAWSLSGAVNAASACSGNLTVEGLYVFVPGVIDVWKVPRRERSWVVPISNRSWKAGG